MLLGSEHAGDQARGRQDDRDGDDGAAVALDERREAHCRDRDGGAVGQPVLALRR